MWGYRGTSLIRTPLGPYSRTTPRVLDDDMYGVFPTLAESGTLLSSGRRLGG